MPGVSEQDDPEATTAARRANMRVRLKRRARSQSGATHAGAWGHERALLYILLTSVSILAGTAVTAYCLWIQRGTRDATEQRVRDMFAASQHAAGS